MAIVTFINKIKTLGIKLWLEDSQLKFKAPKGIWNDEIRDELIAKKAEVIAYLKQVEKPLEQTDIPPIHSVARTSSDGQTIENFPLSFSQERLWFIDQMEPGSVSYNIPIVVNIQSAPDKTLDVNHIEQAFNLIIARHENLRTIFPSHNGKAQQRILERLEFKLECVDLSYIEYEEERRQQARKRCETVAKTPFNLASGPLLKAKIYKLNSQEHVLILNMHHIISDGWSMGVLVKEFAFIMDALRQGKNPNLPPLTFQYLDYSVWQRKWLGGEFSDGNDGSSQADSENQTMLQKQLTYWQQKLDAVSENLNLPTDFPRPNVQTFSGGRHLFSLDQQLTRQLKKLAEKQGCTLYMLLLAVFNVLLYRYSHQEDICIGTPVANRHYEGAESLIGLFINTLVLRNQLEGDNSFASLLTQVKTTCLEAFENQDTPFEKIVDLVQPQRNTAISPLFQVMFVLQNTPDKSLGAGMEAHPVEAGISKFDITLEFNEEQAGLTGSIEYGNTLFTPQTIERMSRHFSTLCRAIISRPTANISELVFIDEAEKQQLLIDFNNTQTDYPQDKCIHELFIEQVAINPDNIAVIYQDETLSYQQLYEQSQTLALYLQSLGVGPDCLVGLCVERAPQMLVAMLAILQAGGAYVPLDPAYPEERLAHMLQDSRAAVVLTQRKIKHKLIEHIADNVDLIVLDSQWQEICDCAEDLTSRQVTLKQGVKPEHLSYIIYTSGSTGKAKGVAIEHRNAVAMLNWAKEVYSHEELSGVLAATSISFDLSVYEIFLTLSTGGKVILVPNIMALPQVVHQDDITLVNTVPSAMEELIRLKAIPESVTTINLAGESLSTRLVTKIYEQTGVQKVYDLYGPSEDTTYSTFTLREANGPQTIGRPINNTQAYVLDTFNNPVPIGVSGELHLAGDGLARGYLYRPELTEEKFVENPFNVDSRMYKTGDLVRWLEDGKLEYLGRIDTQVKIRGFRIELGEIASWLNHFPEIKNSVVIAQGQEGNKQLIAFYVARDTQEGQMVNLAHEDLKAHLQQNLPDYMLPTAFVSLEAIPLTPNGKVDNLALENMDVSLESNQAYLAPRNEIEKQLVAIWAEVLELEPEKIGVNDNFFELGGDSIKTIQIVSKAIEHHIYFDTRDMFNHQNIHELLKYCDTTKSREIIKEEGILEGDVALSPIQQNFLDYCQTDTHHYNQSVLLNLNVHLSEQSLREIVSVLLHQHDALRFRYVQSEQGWQQQYLGADHLSISMLGIESYDIASRGDTEVAADYVAGVCEQLQASLDLNNGPLMRWAYFYADENSHSGSDQLAIIIHHLAIDGVSWRILLEDLNQLIGLQSQNQPLKLAQKNSSYRNWVDSLTAWQDMEQGQQDLAFWIAQSKKPQAGNVVAEESPFATKSYRQQDIQHNNVLLSKASTEKLLKHCHRAYGTEINDLLLTAVMQSYYHATGSQSLSIDMEGHGREQIHPAIDITKTVGWFTSLYPVNFVLSCPDDVGQSIKDVKTALHAIPNKGVGFSIFRYMNQHQAICSMPAAQVLFNFLGGFQAKNPEAAKHYFTFSEKACGNNSSGNREVSNLVTINGMVAFDQLSFNFSYPKDWQGQTICEWQNHFITALETLVEHCSEAPKLGYTPDDFPLLKASSGQLDAIVSVLEQQRHIALDDIQDIYPLTPLQSGILFETLFAQTEDNNGMYITQSAIGFHGQADIKALQKAWQLVINHYDALRMQVIQDNRSGSNAGLQVIQKQLDAPIQLVDWCEKSDIELKSACELRMQENKRAGISFEQGPLLRMSLLQGQTSSYLLFEQHHIMLDGWSQSIVLSNLFKLYQAMVQQQEYSLPDTAPYSAYVQLILNRDQQSEAVFWKSYLSVHEERTPLPMALQLESTVDMTVNRAKEVFDNARISLSKENTLQLERVVKSHRLTMNNLLQFVWALVLHLHSGNKSVTFGSVSSGRSGILDIKHSDQMVGLCINTTPTCFEFDAEQSLLAQLKAMQVRESEKLSYEITPLVEIQELLAEITSKEFNTNEDFFQTLFVYENYPVEKVSESSNLLKDFIGNEAPNYPLAITALSQDTLDITFTYDGYYYTKSTITDLMAQFERITLQLLAKPEALIQDLTLLSVQEKQRLLTDYNQTGLDYAQNKCIHELVAAQVANNPDKTAVVYQGESLTYQKLFDKSYALALYLQSLGVKPDTLVGVCMERSADMLVGMLGIMQAGGAYVPMDPDYPVDRLTYMMQDSQASIVLTQEKLKSRLNSMVSRDTQFIALDEQWAEVSHEAAELTAKQITLNKEVTAQNLAYVIYTSGSTGKPKGVMIEHSSLHALCVWHQKAFNVSKHSKATQVANIAFDASVWEIWPYLINSSSLYVVNNETYTDVVALNHFLIDNQITHSFLATPVAQQLLQVKELIHSDLQYLLIGGDKLSKYEEKSYPFTIVNNYGPTESTVVTTSTSIKGSFTIQNIGRPIANTQTYILDQYNNPVPTGVSGELHIAGASLARGYLNRPELTREKFVTNPFNSDSSGQSTRMYKSGDLVRWLDDGNIEYLGRIDNQVKIRGYRIETGEIESCFNQYPDLKDGAVVVQEFGGNKQLVAFYLANGSTEKGPVEIPRDQLKAYLKQSLPDYMVPAAFVSLAAMPLTPNGKVDRRALTAMEVKLVAEQTYVAPRNETEKQLVAIWAEVLGIEAEQIGIHDNLFELGGDSIKTIQIVSKAIEHDIHFDVRDMFSYQNIHELLQHCDTQKSKVIIKEEGILEGAVDLSPIQSYFFERTQTDLHHFNQSVLLNLNVHLSVEDLQPMVMHLMEQHDALRLRYSQSVNGVQQHYVASTDFTQENMTPEKLGIHVYDIESFDEALLADFVEQTCNQWQMSLDLEDGPIMRWVYFDAKGNGADQLAIIIHHLVIDGVSWRILLENLDQLIGQHLTHQQLQLSLKRSSYRNWVDSLAGYKHSEQGQKDLEYWLEQSENAQGACAAFEDNTYRHKDIQHNKVLLSKSDTEKLLKHCHHAYGTDINDLLLTAVMLSYYQSTGGQKLIIEMEGHGREQINSNIDITSTLGWFTSIFPVSFELSNPQDIGQSIKDIKTALHAIPNKGIGYSIFRYIEQHEAIKSMPEGQVVFNFLGDFQSIDNLASDHHFSLSDNSSGSGSSQQREVDKLVTINGLVVFEQLSFTFSYPAEWHEQKISHWQVNFISVLETLIKHCCDAPKLGYTPDDFPLLSASLAQLDNIVPILEQERSIALDNIKDIYPLTPLQSGILFETLYAQTEDNKGMYLTQSAIGFHGQADINALQQAWQLIINHYDALRMQVITDNSAGISSELQVILNQMELPIKRIDWSDKNDAELKSACELWMQESKRSGISFGQGPLMRMSLFQGQRSSYLLFEQHHIMLDGWSQSIVLSNLFKLYQALVQQQDYQLPPAAPYSAYVQKILNRNLEQDTLYWKGYLSHPEDRTPLPMEHLAPPQNVSNEVFNTSSFYLSQEDTVQFEQLIKKHRLTMSTALQFIWGLLLHLHSGNKTITFGSVSSGRSGILDVKNNDQIVGLCINTTPTCIRFDAELTLLAQLKLMQIRESEKLNYETTPLVHIQNILGNNTNKDLFQTLFVYENYPVEKIAEANNLINDVFGNEAPNYPLSIMALSQEKLAISFTWNGYFYTEETISTLMAQFERLTLQLIAAPEVTIKEVSLISAEERQQLLVDYNNTQVDYPQDKCIHELFIEQVTINPDKIAVVYQDEALSYQQLYDKSHALAVYLQSQGVQPDSLVALCVERSLEMMVGMLGILQAGGAYVPLDPEYPDDRLAYMLEDSQAAIVLTQKKLKEKLSCLLSKGVQLIALDKQWSEINDSAADLEAKQVKLQKEVKAHHLAYMIYTSGSTGQPKGVMVEHRGLVNHMHWIIHQFNLDESKTVLQKTSFNFDAAQWELMVLIGGTKVVVAIPGIEKDPEKLIDALIKYNITTLQCVPAFLKALLENGAFDKCNKLIDIFCGGEALSQSLVDKSSKLLPNSNVYNLYGPTECTIDATAYDCSSLYSPSVSIGTPISNTQIYILDQYNNPVPLGVAGELYIAGDGLARGYFNRPELTEEKFVTNPFNTNPVNPSLRMYKTGDLARWREDGNIEYLGRIDTQIKIRGFRIETGEIETQLNRHPEIKDSVVIAKGQEVNKKLIAFYVVRETAENKIVELPNEALKVHLQQSLPEYMLPAVFVVLEKIPLTPNGKVNRRLLESMEVNLESSQAYVAPRNEMEKQLVVIWAEVLKLEPEKIGINDDFFELGGHSLLATQVISKIRSQLELDVSLKALFNANTLAGISEVIQAIKAQNEKPSLNEDLSDVEFEEVSL